MNNKEKIPWITRTTIFIALLIVVQAAPLENRIITGSIVNFLLIVSVMTCGLASGISVAVIFPVMAKFFGIGPFWVLTPFIVAGNIVFVILWHFVGNGIVGPKYTPVPLFSVFFHPDFIGNRNMGSKYYAFIMALLAAAVAKALVLHIGIVKIAVPVILGFPESQAAAISNTYSIPELFTAQFGGIFAIFTLPTIKKFIRGKISSE